MKKREEENRVLIIFLTSWQVVLSAPAWCPREVQELMTACWHPLPAHRPSFNTIHATLAAYAHAHK